MTKPKNKNTSIGVGSVNLSAPAKPRPRPRPRSEKKTKPAAKRETVRVDFVIERPGGGYQRHRSGWEAIKAGLFGSGDECDGPGGMGAIVAGVEGGGWKLHAVVFES